MVAADARPELSQIVAQEGRRRRHRIVLRWALVVGLAGAGVAAVMIWRPRADVNGPKYRGAAVVRGEVVHEVSATGRVEARSTVRSTLAFGAPVRIRSVLGMVLRGLSAATV